MIISDYISINIGKITNFVFTGHGSSILRLLDSLSKIKTIKLVPSQNEQGASMAADAYSRVSGKIGVVVTTSGPGTLNAFQGIASAYYDSIPNIYISGAPSTSVIKNKNSKLRQLGFQEMDMVKIVNSFCKYAVRVDKPENIMYELEKCIYLSTEGRPGPCLIELPENIQREKFIRKNQKKFSHKKKLPIKINSKINKFKLLIKNSKRPIVIIGQGVKTSNSIKEVKTFIAKNNMPFSQSWGAFDIHTYDNDLNIGSFGAYATIHGNKSIYESDLLIILGCKLNPTMTGSDQKNFAPFSKKIQIDIDSEELKEENNVKLNLKINTDLKQFLKKINESELITNIDTNWYEEISNFKKNFPVLKKEYFKEKKNVNPYVFFSTLSDYLPSNTTLIPDASTNYVWFFQSYKLKFGQKIFSSHNHSSMGYSICASIGAYFGNPKQNIISIIGDGSMAMNIQEIQNIKFHKIPTKIFMIDNKIMAMVAQATDNWFQGKYVGCNEKSGLSFPDYKKVFKSYGIETIEINNNNEIKNKVKLVMKKKGPILCIVNVSPHARIVPKVKFGESIDEIN
ncbi:thiamine pyrophosphate-binding protein [Alphaproteobacteria bacterium]|nr:thiamine pyrophosphate-binding protein [Alphaproteobacteria bacterium]